MDPTISEFKQDVSKTIASLHEELKSIRTGQANPSLVENVIAEVYGGQSKLKLLELSTITTEGPITIVISPFDPSTISDIEKAILKSPLGLSPIVQNNRVLVKIPPLSEEQRKKMIKLVNQIIEEKKEIVRNHRDEARKKIKNDFEEKIITEDDKYRIEKEIDKESQKYMENLVTLKTNKEAEILEV